MTVDYLDYALLGKRGKSDVRDCWKAGNLVHLLQFGWLNGTSRKMCEMNVRILYVSAAGVLLRIIISPHRKLWKSGTVLQFAR